jgi:hypothetical protein
LSLCASCDASQVLVDHQERALLQHYRDCNLVDSGLSAIFVLPSLPDAPWMPLLRMHALRTLPGSALFSSWPDAKASQTFTIYHDAPALTPGQVAATALPSAVQALHSAGQEGGHTFVFSCARGSARKHSLGLWRDTVFHLHCVRCTTQPECPHERFCVCHLGEWHHHCQPRYCTIEAAYSRILLHAKLLGHRFAGWLRRYSGRLLVCGYGCSGCLCIRAQRR